jgi:superoxide dismutase, Cu-Zn family
MKKFGSTATFLAGVALSLACASSGTSSAADAAPGAAKSRATAAAVLMPAASGPVKGRVTFTEEAQGVRVVANISGLTPGKHGFHIHEKGDCSAPDFTSAGAHWNPTAAKHGAPGQGQDHHHGDFGNLEADPQGNAKIDRVFQWLTFTGTNSFVGKAVIVHANPDDLTSQPAGNAGARIACGVIEKTAAK